MCSEKNENTESTSRLGTRWLKVTRPVFSPLFKIVPFLFGAMAVTFVVMALYLASREPPTQPADMQRLRNLCTALTQSFNAILLANAITCILVAWFAVMLIGFAKIHREALRKKRRM